MVATGGDPDGYYDEEISDSIQQVETWTDIVKVIANYGSGEYFTGLILGLKSDGTVVAAQENTWVETVNQWTVR